MYLGFLSGYPTLEYSFSFTRASEKSSCLFQWEILQSVKSLENTKRWSYRRAEHAHQLQGERTRAERCVYEMEARVTAGLHREEHRAQCGSAEQSRRCADVGQLGQNSTEYVHF